MKLFLNDANQWLAVVTTLVGIGAAGAFYVSETNREIDDLERKIVEITNTPTASYLQQIGKINQVEIELSKISETLKHTSKNSSFKNELNSTPELSEYFQKTNNNTKNIVSIKDQILQLKSTLDTPINPKLHENSQKIDSLETQLSLLKKTISNLVESKNEENIEPKTKSSNLTLVTEKNGFHMTSKGCNRVKDSVICKISFKNNKSSKETVKFFAQASYAITDYDVLTYSTKTGFQQPTNRINVSVIFPPSSHGVIAFSFEKITTLSKKIKYLNVSTSNGTYALTEIPIIEDKSL